jgi:PAS domain S-box-containing protein
MKIQHVTALIVDDEQVIRRLLRSCLSSDSTDCLEAGSAEEALEVLKNHTVELILTDIRMPGKSGVELLREVVAGYPDTAAIMISAVANSDTAIECMREGAYDYITKPFNLSEVMMRIEHALEKRSLRIENKAYQLQLEHKVEQQAGTIHASEENFRNSLDNSPLGIRIITKESQTVYANKALLDIYGYTSLEELQTTSAEKRHTPVDFTEHERIKGELLRSAATLNYEVDIVRKNGEIRRLQVNRGEVLWDGQIQYQLLYQDITRRMQAAKALSDSYEKLRLTLDAVIQTLALTAEMKDPYTAGHQRRVAGLACAIAGKLGLSPDQIEGIRFAGLIHDIGKISVPSELLSKPGKITDLEFSLIKQHSRASYDVVKGIEFPWPIAMAVLQHHERMDGSGYPDNLTGKDIILEARILAVADVVEAMASHRPYRPALGIDVALKEISLKKDTQYDPAVVDACLRVFSLGFKFDGD